MFAYIMIFLIKVYQKLFSPEQSFWGRRMGLRVCRFEPTCSRYAVEALRRHGGAKGSYLAICRVLRCHPWNRGGHDPVP